MTATPGVCRFCACTEETPCSTPPCGEPCAWADRGRTVCSAPRCLAAWARAKRMAEAERGRLNRKKTPAEIHELIMRRKRGRSGERRLKGLKPGKGDAA